MVYNPIYYKYLGILMVDRIKNKKNKKRVKEKERKKRRKIKLLAQTDANKV